MENSGDVGESQRNQRHQIMDISDNFLIDFFKDIPKTELIGLFGLINRKKLKKNEIFIDIQKEGPFLSFRHEHRFSKAGEYSELTDHIKFEFFLNPISKFFVAQKIKSQFKARHKATADYLQVEYKNTFCGLT
jgi:ligand-binding SRPBCC domain-containing protein